MDESLDGIDDFVMPEPPLPGPHIRSVKTKKSEPEPDSINFLDDAQDALDNPVQPKPWMKEKKFVLGTVDNLAAIIDACIASKLYSLDLETSGLDNRVFKMPSGAYQTKDRIAGFCVSPDGETGYYIPLHHAKLVKGVREESPHNIPLQVFDREFRRLMEATETGKTVCIFHNAKFDQEFLQFNETGLPWGEWDKPSTWHDTMICVYMRNTRARNKRLKDVSAAPKDADENSSTGGPGLGMEMIRLHELWGHEKEKSGFDYDFTLLDPSDQAILWYGCSDAICTWLLFPVVSPPVLEPDTDGKSMGSLYKIEKSCVAATRWMERNRIHLNREKLKELIFLGHKEWFDSVMEVYKAAEEALGRPVMPPIYKSIREDFVSDSISNLLPAQIQMADLKNKGYKSGVVIKDGKEWPETYDIETPQQLGVMFDEMKVPGLKQTEKSGQIKTDKAEIARIIEEAGVQFPFMHKINKYREVSKALSSFLYPMYLHSEPIDDTMRASFQAHKIDTGRFATPAKDGDTSEMSESMQGWPEINVQAMPNMNNPNRPACLLRIRECITARKNPIGTIPKFIVTIDYSGVELRLVTNLSFEPLWLAEFFHCSTCNRTFDRIPREGGIATKTPQPPPARCTCGSDKIGDLHTLTAISIYGADAPNKPDWKALRGDAKSVNFALCYGGGGGAVIRAIKSKVIDKNEGARIKQVFDRTYSGLKKWWDSMHKFARKHKFVRTAFGRRYPVPDINAVDGGFRSKAERNSVNGPIQGTSADITKLAMALIYKEMKKRGWLEKVMMIITMHDELVFEIDGDIIEEAIPLLVNIMGSNNPILEQNWPIPLTSDVEMGFDWSVPWDLNGMTYKEVRFIKDKKFKDAKKLPEGVDWNTLPTWPEALKPWFSAARNETPPPPTTPPPAAPAPDGTPTPPAAPGLAAWAATTPITEDEGIIPPSGGEYIFRLKAPLCLRTACDLAALIAEFKDGGTRILTIKTINDEPIEGWAEEAGFPTPLHIDAVGFERAARRNGLGHGVR